MTLAGAPLLWHLPFDSNPMHLRSTKTQSIATYLDLIKDPETSPNLIDVLAPNVNAVPGLSKTLAALPVTASVNSIDTFVPRDQDKKLAQIADTAQLLDPVLNPGRKPPPPTDAENVKALKDAATALNGVAGDAKGDAKGAQEAKQLAGTLDTLAAGPVPQREAASVALTKDLVPLLAHLRDLLHPEKITLDNLPPQLKADWVAADGRARIEVHPKGDSNDDTVLRTFSDEVLKVAPHATGAPVATTQSSYTILGAFVQAALTAFVLIFVILSVALRKPWDVAMTLGPLVIATLWTLMALRSDRHAAELRQHHRPAADARGRRGLPHLLRDRLAGGRERHARLQPDPGDLLLALTTGSAFGFLVLSSHPGTASMGKLLALSLFFTLIAAFFVVPATLGEPPMQPDEDRPEAEKAAGAALRKSAAHKDPVPAK